MEISGNERAIEYFKRQGVPKEGTFYKYDSDKVTKYREMLDRESNNLLGEPLKEEVKQEKVEIAAEDTVFDEIVEEKQGLVLTS